MAARPDYVKIGLFVLLGLGAVLATAIAIGLTSLHHTTISYFTYFNEAVTGLEVGAPVKVRGVTAGQVGAITIAPDHRMVEVRTDLDVGVLERMGLRQRGIPATASTETPEDLRAQLMTQGLTGNRFVGLDFFDAQTNPPPHLTFQPPKHYIPAARSMQQSLEEAATKAMTELAGIVDTLQQHHVGEHLAETIAHADSALSAVDQVVQSISDQRLVARGGQTLDEVGHAASNVNHILIRVDGRTGLVASATRTVDSFGNVGRNATDATRNLSGTVAEIREAAGAIRLLAEELEQDPDMLLKGRAKKGSP